MKSLLAICLFFTYAMVAGRADDDFELAVKAIATRDFDEMIKRLDAVVQRNPSHGLAYRLRGSAYFQKGDYAKAIADCTEAIRLMPNSPEAYQTRGMAFEALRQFDRAIQDHTKVIELMPGSSDGYYFRGLCFHSNHEFERALADFQIALGLKQESKTLVARGTTYISIGDTQKAVADFDRAIQVNPKDAKNRWRNDACVALDWHSRPFGISPGRVERWPSPC